MTLKEFLNNIEEDKVIDLTIWHKYGFDIIYGLNKNKCDKEYDDYIVFSHKKVNTDNGDCCVIDVTITPPLINLSSGGSIFL